MLMKVIETPDTSSSLTGYVQVLPVDPSVVPDNSMPAILFCHGMGEQGDGSDVGLDSVRQFIESTYNQMLASCSAHGFILVAPQLPWINDWKNQYVRAGFDMIWNNKKVDKTRIHIVGISLGGGAVYEFLGVDAMAKYFASAISICGVVGWSRNEDLKPFADNPVTFVAYHGSADYVVSKASSTSAVNIIKSLNLNAKATYVELPGKDHYIWGDIFKVGGTYDVGKFLLGQKLPFTHPYTPVNNDGGGIISPAPTPTPADLNADASASPTTVTGTTAVLDVSRSTGYSSAGTWKNISVECLERPEKSSWDIFKGFKSNGLDKYELQNLIPGAYVFKVTVMDGKGGSNSIIWTIIVEAAPISTLTPAVHYLREMGIIAPDANDLTITQGTRAWSLADLLEDYIKYKSLL